MAINRHDDQRAEHRHYYGKLSVTTQGTVYAPYARQASTKRRDSNGSDVQ